MTLRIKTLTAVAALTLGAAAWAQDAAVTTPVPDNATPAQAAATAAGNAATATGDAAAATADAAAQAADTAVTTVTETVTETVAPAATDAAAATADAAGQAAAAAGATASETVAAEDAATAEAAPAPAAAAETPAVAAEQTASDAELSEEAATSPEATDAVQAEEAAADAATPPADAAAEEDLGKAAAMEGTAEIAAGAEAEATSAADAHAAAGGDAGGHAVQHIADIAFSFEGPFGKFDQFQLQRGLQVYTEVCSACHGMKQVALRTLGDEGGPHLPADQVRAYAANLDITDPETGEDRPRIPTDYFPTVTGEGMGPDLSLMAKARAGFHGPYGTGISQLFNGIGGPEYIYSVLTGYNGETKEQAGTTLYHNAAFAGNWIGMPQPLQDDQVTYEDGTPATVDQMAKDVAAFLMWTAEPHMMARKKIGFVSVIFLIALASLLYLTNKRLWAPIKHGQDA